MEAILVMVVMVVMVITRELLKLSQDMVMKPATTIEAHKVRVITAMAMATIREMLSQVMVMLQVMTTESRDSKVIMVMAMAREMLSQVMDMVLLLTIHMEVTVLSTEALRV